MPIGYIFAAKKGEEKDYFERFGVISIKKPLKNTIWFHCASVGEVKSLTALISLLRKEFDNISIIVSTTTATGKKFAMDNLEIDVAFLLPIENSIAISYLIDVTDTKLFFIVDTEIWPNLIRVAAKKVHLYLINARISDKSFIWYKRFRFFFGGLLNKFNKIFAKSSKDAEKFQILTGGNKHIIVTGNIKFFLTQSVKNENIIDPSKRIFVAASTHEREEEYVLDCFIKVKDLFDHIVIAPRHLNRVDEVEALCKKWDLSVCRISNYNIDAKVVIVDRFGLLEYLYSIADKIFVGGSLTGVGGHNIFEALQFKKAVSVGSNMSNFIEIFELAKKYNLVQVINDKQDLVNFLKEENRALDFEVFFREIEEKNKAILAPVISEIKKVMTTQKED